HMPGEIGGIESVAGADGVDHLDLWRGNLDVFAIAPCDRAFGPALDHQRRGGWEETQYGVGAAKARNLLLVEQDVVGKAKPFDECLPEFFGPALRGPAGIDRGLPAAAAQFSKDTARRIADARHQQVAGED